MKLHPRRSLGPTRPLVFTHSQYSNEKTRSLVIFLSKSIAEKHVGSPLQRSSARLQRRSRRWRRKAHPDQLLDPRVDSRPNLDNAGAITLTARCLGKVSIVMEWGARTPAAATLRPRALPFLPFLPCLPCLRRICCDWRHRHSRAPERRSTAKSNHQ